MAPGAAPHATGLAPPRATGKRPRNAIVLMSTTRFCLSCPTALYNAAPEGPPLLRDLASLPRAEAPTSVPLLWLPSTPRRPSPIHRPGLRGAGAAGERAALGRGVRHDGRAGRVPAVRRRRARPRRLVRRPI